MDLVGIQQLSQLKALKLHSFNSLEFSSSSTSSWRLLTALETLALGFSVVQPQAVAALTQLRSLSLTYIKLWQASTLSALLTAVAQLSQLTELVLTTEGLDSSQTRPAATAFTALTSSTHLCSLQLGLCAITTPRNWVLF
jgi:hypothetical protein